MSREKKTREKIDSLKNEFLSVEQLEARYYLSEYAYLTLQRDCIRFTGTYTEKFSNSYLCQIIMNYMKYVNEHNLEDQFREKVIQEIIGFKKNTNKSQGIRNRRMTLREKMKEDIMHLFFSSEKAESLFKQIDAEKLSHFKPALVSCALECFANLSFSERELVYCYELYQMIMAGKAAEAIIKITYRPRTDTSTTAFEVKTFDVLLDENSASHYLLGYSRKQGSDGLYEGYSFKLSRIKECELTRKQYILTKIETEELKKQYQRFGAAYVYKQTEDDSTIIVRLSKFGYENLYLRIIAHQRPLPANKPEQVIIDGQLYYIMELDCSYEQIRNYFFSFGAEAEILSPNSLRDQFKEELAAALNLYVQDSDKAE